MRTVGGYTISRRPLTSNSDTSVNVIHPTPPSKQARQSLQTLPSAVEMDFSQRSSMGPTGPEFSLWLESTANSAPMEELEELTQSAGFQSAKYDQRVVYDSPASTISTASTSRPIRRPLPNPDDFRNGTRPRPCTRALGPTTALPSARPARPTRRTSLATLVHRARRRLWASRRPRREPRRSRSRAASPTGPCTSTWRTTRRARSRSRRRGRGWNDSWPRLSCSSVSTLGIQAPQGGRAAAAGYSDCTAVINTTTTTFHHHLVTTSYPTPPL